MAQTRLHFVGIGGIGMSGIAEVFLNQGFPVSGSDLSDSETTRRLRSLGAVIFNKHGAENVRGASVVVTSSAIRADNPEVAEARKLRIPVIPRAEMLGELMRGKTGIAVAGTHGKTTTTSMLATVLTEAGSDPTIVIGGKVDSLGGNAKLGQGKLVVAEADESDGSFLKLPATYGIITNIDNDHLDYYGSEEAIDRAFVDFVGNLPFYGLVVVCADDPGVKKCLARFAKPFVTYGFSADCDFYVQGMALGPGGSSFEVWKKGTRIGKVELSVLGRHNVLNALAVIALSDRLEIPFEKVAQALVKFQGVKRRFEIRWKNESTRQVIVDDYGHHPTEVLATLAAARKFWPGRIVTVFQPHRYSRTLHCKEMFMSAFDESDLVFVTEIYSAGEDPIAGISGEGLAKGIAAKSGKDVRYAGSLEQARDLVMREFKAGDLVLCLGAGSITKLPGELMQALEK